MLNSSTPQRDLRAPIPTRTTLRFATSTEHHAMIAGHLTVRDRWIARMLAEHRVLTSTQIAEIAFPSRRATNLRLRKLYQWRVIDRFQPYIGRGRAPMFYVLDTAGAHALAYEDGIDPRALKFRSERSIGVSHSHRLAHLHGSNSFFTGLIHRARTADNATLTAWWPETRCNRLFGDIIRPDSYGRWREAGHSIEWFLEWDTGSYPLTRVATKLQDYARLTSTTNIITPVLFCFSSGQREAHARPVLARTVDSLAQPGDVPIATTSLDELHDGACAADTVWLPIGQATSGRRPIGALSTIWPQITEPTGDADTPAAAGNHPALLLPPSAMPSWSGADELTWNTAGGSP